MASTRQLILEHLQRRFPASAVDLSRALGLTAANIRHHLAILVKEGALADSSVRPAQGRGRPARLYSLAGQARSHNLGGLASALLDGFLEDYGDNQAALHSLAERMAVTTQQSGPSTLTRRLNLAVSRLNQLKYEARWEARTRAPQVIFGHCPYAEILDEHPELCRLDAHLLEALLGSPVSQTDRLAQDKIGRTFCRFSLLRR
jgi:predicted ArsR family transcriptional regulator